MSARRGGNRGRGQAGSTRAGIALQILFAVLLIDRAAGALQAIRAAFAAILRRTLGIDGPLALEAAVHISVGMIEAPPPIRPYLRPMQRGELFASAGQLAGG